MLLQSYIRMLLREASQPPAPLKGNVTLKADDLDGLLVESKLLWHTPKGVRVFCPYGHPGEFPRKYMDGTAAAVVDQLAPAVFDVVNVVKKDVALEGPSGAVKLQMSDGDRRVWWTRMASRIASKFSNERVAAVAYADSRSDMASFIAEAVAKRLGVPLVKALVKNTDPGKIKINADRFARWAAGKPEAEVESFRDQLETNLRTLQNKAKAGKAVSIAGDIDVKRREFFRGIHDVVPGTLDSVKGNVLVVDDNVDSGMTFVDIEAVLKDFQGVTPLFAAGFRINRSSAASDAARKAKAAAAAAAKEEAERLQRLAAAGASGSAATKWKVDEPHDYAVGDAVEHPTLGLGSVERVAAADRKVYVNFASGLKPLVYTPATTPRGPGVMPRPPR